MTFAQRCLGFLKQFRARVASFRIYSIFKNELLQKFLDRSRVYNTELFHAESEPQARENLKRSIARLN